MAAAVSADVVKQDFIDGNPASLTELRAHTLPAASALHSLAFKGAKYEIPAQIEEEYDLVIVGAGLSGLSAALFYRQRFGPEKKILIVDALEDFGGHAKRNEFTVDGKLILGYGGSESLQSPKANFSPTAHALLKTLNVDISLFDTKFFQHTTYSKLGLSRGSFFDSAKFGKDVLVKGDPTAWVSDDVLPANLNAEPLDKFIGAFPLSDATRVALHEVYTSKRVTLAEYATPEKRLEYLSATNYAAFLRTHWNLSDEAISYFNQRTLDFFGLAPSKISALDAGHYGYPGMQGIDLPHNAEAAGDLSEPYIHHWPDGNASLARLLVRHLIPGVAPGNTMEDIVLAKFDYSKLDLPQSHTRLRLNTAAVQVSNSADGHVDLGVVKTVGDTAMVRHIRSKHCILACFNMAIPFLFAPGALPAEQAAALKQNVKAPLVYTNVVLRNWHPFVKLGVHEVFGVGTFHSRIKLDYPVCMGGYSSALDPSQPVVVHMVHVPHVNDSTSDPRTALRLARKTLFGKSFADFEKLIVADLTKVLGPGGFDASRDIAAITVNRWSHGYAYGLNTLAETEEEGKKTMEIARKPVGNVSISGSDAGWSAYAHSAIDEAYRAVQELSVA